MTVEGMKIFTYNPAKELSRPHKIDGVHTTGYDPMRHIVDFAHGYEQIFGRRQSLTGSPVVYAGFPQLNPLIAFTIFSNTYNYGTPARCTIFTAHNAKEAINTTRRPEKHISPATITLAWTQSKRVLPYFTITPTTTLAVIVATTTAKKKTGKATT
ncbi:hypothetical protein EDD18DRAFT_1385267 [Armillaria luteobubalina]|uniref:Uncharacterized protein n=1 Tax=Armillaria luteobubalina TaxID=153913 RepID=A0AA39UFA3_9AGAR|nr:hypothetical protein EDD18DRAFT_1385267 [Armillaria luteobubalina]